MQKTGTDRGFRYERDSVKRGKRGLSPFSRGPRFRVERLDDERVVYRLPKPQRDGTTALTLTPLELIDHLAALIPPPRRHRHRYHCHLTAMTPPSPAHNKNTSAAPG
jgi:hypothetical protein